MADTGIGSSHSIAKVHRGVHQHSCVAEGDYEELDDHSRHVTDIHLVLT